MGDARLHSKTPLPPSLEGWGAVTFSSRRWSSNFHLEPGWEANPGLQETREVGSTRDSG